MYDDVLLTRFDKCEDAVAFGRSVERSTQVVFDAATRGERMRWEGIVDRHGPLVWRCAYRLLGHHADAADCYQDTFVAALAVARRATVRHWPALLRRIVRTHAIDRLRQRSIRGVRVPIESDVDVDAASAARSRVPEPSQAAEARELRDAVRAAVAQLPQRHAAAFTLTCFEGMSHDEAAVVLGVSTNNVGVLSHRARVRLRELLAPVGGVGEVRDAAAIPTQEGEATRMRFSLVTALRRRRRG
jgi:RNA polymerase sigma-70 factor (ECF subfamily)